MYGRIRKKYIRTLSLMVVSVLFFFSLLIFFVYSNRLVRDYREKVHFFNEQRVSEIEKTIRQIEYSVDVFFSRTGDSISSNTYYELISYLEQLPGNNRYISSLFLVDDDLNCITPIRILVNFSRLFLENYPSLFADRTPGESWYYVEKLTAIAQWEATVHDVLIYMKTVQEENGKTYTLVVLVPENTLLLTAFSKESTTGFFSKDNYSAQLLIPDECVLPIPEIPEDSPEDLKEASDTSRKPSSKNRGIIPIEFSRPIEDTPFSLNIYNSGTPLAKQLMVFAAGIFGGFLLISGIAVLVLHLYIRRLVRGLGYLSREFTEFSDSLSQDERAG